MSAAAPPPPPAPAPAPPGPPPSRLLQLGLVVLVLAVGLAGAGFLASHRQAPPSDPPRPYEPLVRTEAALARDVPVVVEGHGTVRAARRLALIPRVSGPVVSVHRGLVEGGRFEKDEVLLAIEPDDYEQALLRARARLAEADAAVEIAAARIAEGQARLDDAKVEQARQRDLVASDAMDRRALEKAEIQTRIAAKQLEGLQAQLASAQATQEGARIAVATAETDLARTALRAPFAGRVLAEDVAVGQWARAGEPVATVYEEGALEVAIPLDDRDLAWIDLRTGATDGAGARARVIGRLAGAERILPGRVVRLDAEADARSQMVAALIALDAIAVPEAAGRPLLPGDFVRVEIEGRTLKDAVVIPRRAVRDGDVVWVVADGRLHIRKADIARSDRERAYLRAGVADGELVVTSPLDAVTDGMRVRTSEPAPGGEGERVLSAPTPAAMAEPR